jgi:hypothetical protein
MEKESLSDRLERAARPVLLGLLVITGPVFFFTYAWGMKLLLTVVPLWAWALICLCHVMAWLGVASLFDTQQERRTRR